LLGHIDAASVFPGLGRLDRDAAERAMAGAGVDPEGVIAVVNAHMEQALRVVSVERGVDPRELALVAFGGAGPLHACALADALEMTAVVVPARAGVFSAVGILAAARREDRVRSWPRPLDHEGVAEALTSLADEAVGALGEPVERVETAVDCRYAGQSHELTVPSVADFPQEHRRRNGYVRPDHPVEVVALRARAFGHAPTSVTELPVLPRQEAKGPSVIAEDDCTIWLPDGWIAEAGAAGALVLRRST
jgi:N-methylhydantoinase A/oxoprolinase/acetone carboxylase beta subunit